MNMKPKDIVLEFQQAKDKRNQCSKDEILDVLVENGCSVDRRWYSKQRREQSGEAQPITRNVQMVADPAGRIITEENAAILAAFMEEAVPQYVMNNAFSQRECMVRLHKLTGIYMDLISD